MPDPVALTQQLIRFDTVNPPGRERECAMHLADLLDAGGFEVRMVELAGDRRASLIARHGRPGSRRPLVFTGHIDVVPLGTRTWSRDPFGGEIGDGRIHGRGASDMKSGVAAFVAAAMDAAGRGDSPELVLVITAGEETGCEGAESIVAAGLQGEAGALVVCEPTANAPFVGHKGALWLKAVLSGITAHGSMPERGDNAVYKAARAVNRLSCFHFGTPAHPVLGAPTLNVGSLHGGLNINSVPDRAEIEIDMRTTPGLDHAELRDRILAHMEEDAKLETLVDLPGIWTAPEDPWAASVAEIAAKVTGEPRAVKTATYFSDASIFVPAMGGPPTLILGPGEPALAHQTDEWCGVERVRQAHAIYSEIIARWN